jgi:spore coat polysaccharide biosynthesis predicted glycosyltransferase SpsG
MVEKPSNALDVLFVTAASPAMGFGHLVRCSHVAAALEGTRRLVIRGSEDATWIAVRRGWTIVRGAPRHVLGVPPDLIVIDDPSASEMRRWVRAARRAGVPVATVRDGVGPMVESDLEIDGSFGAEARKRGDGRGLRWTLVDPSVEEVRRHRHRRHDRQVLIALGGGEHVQRLGARIANELSRLAPEVSIRLAAGFVESHPLPRLTSGCQWISAPDGLASALSRATVAIVAGGVTLQEACALGTPVVAVPVVASQSQAVRHADRLRVARGTDVHGAARVALSLLQHPDAATAQGQRAARLIDGHGVHRVADRLRALVARTWSMGVRHAA